MAIIVVVVAVDYGFKAAGSASAIVRWRGLIELLVQGKNAYNEPGVDGSFPNPPVAAIVLWPLTLLPPVPSAMVWFAIKVVMAAAAFHWSVRLATGDDGRLSTPATAALLVLIGRPLLSDLEHGNINTLLLFVVTAGLWAFRCGRDATAGVAIGLATAIKVTPALFIPYFAYKRQWRLVAAACAGVVLFLVFVPGLVLGFDRNLWLLRSWAGAMVWPYVLDGQIETLQTNQSLAGVLMRLATDSPAIEWAGGSTVPANVLNLDRSAALLLLKTCFMAIIAAVAWLARTTMADRRDWRLACEYALVFIAMLLISERSWKHHFVTMLLPYAVLVAYCGRATCSPPMRRLIWSALAVALILMASTSSELGGWLAGGVGHKYAQAYGAFAGSAIVAFVAVAALLRQRSIPQRAASATTSLACAASC
jgi:hypothetical protein